MSVRIDNDFWTNYAEHETLLRRCFMSLYHKKYPCKEGAESAYNFLIAEFFRKNLFERFEAEREGKYNQTTIENKSSQKKFEQYVYVWSESIIGGLYHSERKHSERNLRFATDKLDGMTEHTYESFKENAGISSWKTISEEDPKKQAKLEEQSKRRKNVPCIADADDYRAQGYDSAFDTLREKELMNHLNSVAKNDRERTVIECKAAGLNNTDVGAVIGVSSSQVANILNGIKKRCSSAILA